MSLLNIHFFTISLTMFMKIAELTVLLLLLGVQTKTAQWRPNILDEGIFYNKIIISTVV